jgi:hypothetical protein
MIGTLSLFNYALFSGRALRVVTYGQLPSFETALSPVDGHIDWCLQGGIDDKLIGVLKYMYRSVRGYVGDSSYDPAVVDTTMFWPVCMVNDFDAADALFGLQRTMSKEEKGGDNNTPSVDDSSSNGSGCRCRSLARRSRQFDSHSRHRRHRTGKQGSDDLSRRGNRDRKQEVTFRITKDARFSGDSPQSRATPVILSTSSSPAPHPIPAVAHCS